MLSALTPLPPWLVPDKSQRQESGPDDVRCTDGEATEAILGVAFLSMT